jgi:HSP20 family protein
MLWTKAFVPAVDVAVSESDLVITMDLPGFTSEDVALEVVDDTLIVRSERNSAAAPEGTVFTHTERGFGQFARTVRLPAGVDPDAVTASLENGVLSLIVPKPERLRPKEIQIGTGGERKELTAA